VRRFDRATGWEAEAYDSLGDALELPALGKRAVIGLSDIYRGTLIGAMPRSRKR
jgi:hypothetical protein